MGVKRAALTPLRPLPTMAAMRASRCKECNGLLDPYLPECSLCGKRVDDASFTHDPDLIVERTAGGSINVSRRWKFHFPWGLLILLGVYAWGAQAYVKHLEETSPLARAQLLVDRGSMFLGKDYGITASDSNLIAAYGVYLEAASIVPGDKWVFDKLDTIRHLALRRNLTIPEDLQQRADFLGRQNLIEDKHRLKFLVAGPSDIWNFDTIRSSPRTAATFAIVGGLLICLIWSYTQFQSGKAITAQEDEKEAARRLELAELSRHRRQVADDAAADSYGARKAPGSGKGERKSARGKLQASSRRSDD